MIRIFYFHGVVIFFVNRFLLFQGLHCLIFDKCLLFIILISYAYSFALSLFC